MKPQKRNLFFLLVILPVIFVVGFILKLFQSPLINDSSHIPDPTHGIFERKAVSLSGEVVCLPSKNTSGPQTLECAIGLHADDGNYYALDTNLLSQNPPGYSNGDTVKVSGIITPIELLSTDHFQKYNVKGVFSVESLKVLE